MTMQVAIVATDGIVLASDTQESGAYGILKSSSKVSLAPRHCAAVGFAGYVAPGTDQPDAMLASHLESLSSLGDVYDTLEKWAADYPGQVKGVEVPQQSLIVAICNKRHRVFSVLTASSFGHKRSVRPIGDVNYHINGQPANSAMFWPKFFRINQNPQPLNASTAIAAITILAGGRISPDTVGGLDVWRCRSGGQWEEVGEDEKERLREGYRRIETAGFHCAGLSKSAES